MPYAHLEKYLLQKIQGMFIMRNKQPKVMAYQIKKEFVSWIKIIM